MSFTNQMLGALGTATGALAAGEHIVDQKQQKAFAALEKLQSVDDNLKLKQDNQAEAEKTLADAEREQSSEDLAAAIAGQSGIIDKLTSNEKEYFSQIAKGQSRDDKTGRFISQEEAYIRYADLMQELEKAKKAKKSLDIKWEVRKNMIDDVSAKKEQVRLAKELKNQAQSIYEKNMKYLRKGPKGGNE